MVRGLFTLWALCCLMVCMDQRQVMHLSQSAAWFVN